MVSGACSNTRSEHISLAPLEHKLAKVEAGIAARLGDAASASGDAGAFAERLFQRLRRVDRWAHTNGEMEGLDEGLLDQGCEDN